MDESVAMVEHGSMVGQFQWRSKAHSLTGESDAMVEHAYSFNSV